MEVERDEIDSTCLAMSRAILRKIWNGFERQICIGNEIPKSTSEARSDAIL
jgi:hypothetical protein